MSNLTTLTSLAMLKVNADAEKRDYLEYLRPFVLQILSSYKIEPITDVQIAHLISQDFGLKIPNSVINLFLKRLANKGILKKDNEIYILNKAVNAPPNLIPEMEKAKRHITAISKALYEYSQDKLYKLKDEKESLNIILAFLSEFSIECLKTYIFGTTLPKVLHKKHKMIVLTSQFLRDIHKNNPQLFDSFVVLTKGHMLANALICPDLDSLTQLFSKTTFYLDTPVIARLLGLAGEIRETAATEMVTMARKLGAKFAVFLHTKQELYNVIIGAAHFLDSPEGRGSIVREMRKAGKTYSDMILIANKIDDYLLKKGVRIIDTPKYNYDLQIDEAVFEGILEEEIDYYNPKARLFDINSVRSIYAIRESSAPCRLEDSKATLVTSNVAFAKAAFEYGKGHESTKEISSVITDFSLANIVWLKSPVEASELPKTEILSYSYAALNPPEALWVKYIQEIDKLKEQSEITARDHAILKCSLSVPEQLMDLTLGDEEALTKQNIREILEKTKGELTQEKDEMLLAEKDKHDKIKKELGEAIEDKMILENHLDKFVKKLSKFILLIPVYMLLILVTIFFWNKSNSIICKFIETVFVVVTACGFTIRDIFKLRSIIEKVVKRIIAGNIS